MPTLDWIGKKAVVNHHNEVFFHLLREAPELSCGEPESGNLLVEGDNLLALKALLPYYAGQVKCIYIDPPYNTGNENWIYNDNVNSPEIRKWLGKVVGGELEDLSRHDKWLCMMYPRLSLLKELLGEDGLIFVSIDDNELHLLKLMMDEIFGPTCQVSLLVWKSRHFTDTRPLNGVSEDHEYLLVYSRSPRARLRGKTKDFSKYANPDNDPRGSWTSCSLLGKATRDQRPNLHYDFKDPVRGRVFHCPSRTGWICAKETMIGYAREGRLLYPKKEGGRLRVKVYVNELKSEFMGFPSVITDYATSDGTAEVRDVLGDQIFSFPKPSQLVAALVEQSGDKNCIVLDSFSGSGTTGHAVMQLNKQDGGNRKFILIEMDSHICQGVTAERLKRVCKGYKNQKGEKVEGLGGGFRYCKLGSPCFDEQGRINPEVKYDDLARHVFFTETGSPLPKRSKAKAPLIGIHDGVAVYLLYNGVLKDKDPGGGNVLTQKVLASLPKHDGPKVVFGTACRLGRARLKAAEITFRQIPYEIRVR